MGHKAKQSSANSRVDFFYYAFRNVLLVSIPLLVVSGLVLSHLSLHNSATGSGTDQIQFSLSTSCTMSSVVDEAHTKAISNGTYHSDVGKTTITTLCNDGNGYSVYAVGYSNNEEGNTKLINAEHPEFSIDTGLATSGLISNWAMKLNNIPDDPSPTPPTIETEYNNTYGVVSNIWTKVASRASGTTDIDEGSSFTTTYAIYTTSNQHAGTYNGQVKYVLTHPSIQLYVYYMQEVDKWKNELALEESLQAIDARDGKKYWVTRLADGHIWMTQNLDFDINSDTTLNSGNTDLNVIYNSATGQYAEYDSGYSQANNIIYWKPISTATTINFTGNTVTGWQNSNTEPYSTNKTDDINIGHASLGNYYNWTAAIASNNSSTLASNTYNDVSQNPQNSICPKGWRLPTISNQEASIIGSTNEFARLNQLYNAGATNTDTGLISDPLYFVTSGEINADSKTGGIGYSGNYLSSSFNGSSAGFLKLTATQVIPNGSYGKIYGWSIRCIAK